MSPRHHDIADDLRQQITTGHMVPGERLPSEVDLADRYKVSTVTLRRALAVLQGDGLVEKIHGKGNFVRRPPRKIVYVGGWGTLDPWTAAEAALRVTVRTTTVPACSHLTTLLKVPTGSPLTEFFCVSHEGESARDWPASTSRTTWSRLERWTANPPGRRPPYASRFWARRRQPSERRYAPARRRRTKHRPSGPAPPRQSSRSRASRPTSPGESSRPPFCRSQEIASTRSSPPTT